MAYKKTNWQDTLRDAQGNVIQKGTPLNAQALGKIEDGIVAAEQKIDTEIGKVTTQLAQTTTESTKQIQNVMNTQLQQKSLRRPLLTFVDDDGTDDVYQKIKPLTDELKFKMTCAIVSNFVNKASYMTEAQLSELHKTGLYEFVSHTANHPALANLTTDEERLTEMIECRDWLQKRGYTGNIIVYPYGSTNSTVRRNAQKVYRAGVNIDNSFHYVNYPNPLKSYDLQRVYIDYGVDVVKTKIDEAIANNGWLIVGMHCFYDTWTQSDLRTIVEYARNKGIDIVSLAEGLDVYGNILEVGDSLRPENQRTQFINCDGESFGADVSKVVHRVHGVDGWDVTIDTPATYFPSDKTTVTIYLSSASVGMPSNGLGVLITKSFSVNPTRYWTTQEFVPSGSTTKYERYWIVGTSKWSNFVEVGTSFYYKKHNSVTASTPISDFAVNSTTVTTVVANSGFPQEAAGTVVTYNYGAGYAYQTFKKHNANVIYFRTWSSTSNAWLEWQKDQQGTWGFVSVPFGTINANSYKAITVTIDGVTANDILTTSPPIDLPDGLIVSNPIVTAANTVQFRIYNTTAANVTSNASWKYIVLKSAF